MEEGFINIGPYSRTFSHTRFSLTLRSEEGEYHSLILFRLSSANQHGPEITNDVAYKQLYAMEAACPHLGADMSHADIEDYCGEDGEDHSTVVVCPWHRYDFDLATGKSETGLRACVYEVRVRQPESDGEAEVWVEAPQGGTGWQLVNLRPVSEEFADPPPNSTPGASILPPKQLSDASMILEPIVPDVDPPMTLVEWAVLILNTPNPTLKVGRTRHAVKLFQTGELKSIGHRLKNTSKPPDIPPRDASYTQNTVDPGKTAGRKNKGVMLHALANIEQWAIDLSWDIIARYGSTNLDLPHAFFSDWARIALDESKHFTLLTKRLVEISPSTPYGSLPVHAGLWESARVTFHSLRSRLAIIHLVHEARGLDVNPATIEKFRRSGDLDTVAILEIIHMDEVTHVTAGHRWFSWMCKKEGVDPIQTFREEVRRGWRGDIKGPFNEEDRAKAGMTRDFYTNLRGEMGDASKVAIGYEQATL